MTPFEKLQQRLRSLNWDRNQLETALRSKDGQIKETKKQITDALNSGASTGDRLLDLVWRQHQRMDVDLALKYDLLEQKLRPGEFILIGYEGEVTTRHHSRGQDTEPRTFYRIGVLTDDKLQWCEKGKDDMGLPDVSGIVFPVERFVAFKKEDVYFDIKKGLLPVVERNILSSDMSHRGYPFLAAHIDPEMFRGLMTRHGLTELVIGDKEVKEWLRKSIVPQLFRVAADSLSKLVLEPTD